MLLHAFFAWHQGFTNDEGAYLYDARTILRGELPAGDVVTKAPVPILFFAIGEVFTGESLYAARLVNSLFSIVSCIPLYYLLRVLSGEKGARVGLVLWLLGSGSIVFHSMGHTQAISNFFVLLSLCLFVLGIRSQKIIEKYIYFSGICFLLAYASRKTAIAVLIPIVITWIMFRETNGELKKTVRLFFTGAMSIGFVWILAVYSLYGIPGVLHAGGAGYGSMVVRASTIEPWAGNANHMVGEAVRIGSFYVALLVIICVACMRERVLIGASWVAGLTVLYALWPTHLVEYLADFIPAIVIAGVCSITSFRMHRWQLYVLAAVFVCMTSASLYSVILKPWTGMFTRQAVESAAKFLSEHVALSEEVVTAAVIVPYVSGHNVPFHLSHPQWYRYSFVAEDDKRLFLPSYPELKVFYEEQASWVLRDQLFDYVYPDIRVSDTTLRAEFSSDTKFRQNKLRVYNRQ